MGGEGKGTGADITTGKATREAALGTHRLLQEKIRKSEGEEEKHVQEQARAKNIQDKLRREHAEERQ